MNRIIFILFAVWRHSSAQCGTQCPEKSEGLVLWSADSSLPNGNTPDPTLDVTINHHVLLDTSPPEFRGLIIGPNGRVVFKPNSNIHLQCRYILIFGRMDIGSETCPYEGEVNITLKGDIDEYGDIPGFGQKFIGVEAGGTLEMHGEPRLPFTKLTATLNKANPLYDRHKEELRYEGLWKEGVTLYIIDQNTMTIDFNESYYLSGSTDYSWLPQYIHDQIQALTNKLNGTGSGKIALMAVQNTARRDESIQDMSALHDAFEIFAFGSVTGNSEFRNLGHGDAYAMIAYSGDPTKTVEMSDAMSQGSEDQYVVLESPDFALGIKFTVQSYVDNGNFWDSYVNFRWSHTDDAYPILNLLEVPNNWHEGDTIFLTSTDFDMDQLEYGTIIDCNDACNPNQIRVDLEARYTHFGEVVQGVDMRGEVGLETRNIRIRGEVKDHCPPANGNCGDFPYDTFGGQIKVLKDFANVHIEGVELVHMGQQTSLGKYPLHFHMCEDVSGYENPPYLRSNSVHDSFARCFTVHGTHGLLLIDNVCIWCLGHAYFLEDGGEKNTVLDGNLGALTWKGSLISSDNTPSTFWITNPLTTFINNVAAGSEDKGIWVLFPDEPTGASAGKGFMDLFEARETAFTQFENNVAHSNNRDGLFVDSHINDDLTVGGINHYVPKVYPLNTTDPWKKMYITLKFNKTTLYKNRNRGAWLRGGIFDMHGSSFADNQIGLTFASANGSHQFLTDSIILGETKNLGEPSSLWNSTINRELFFPRSYPVPYYWEAPRTGFEYYDGPVHIDNVWFNNFKSTENYTMGAIGFLRKNKFSSSPVSSAKNVQFGFDDAEEGNQVFDGDENVPGFGNYDGDKVATFRNKDTGKQIVKPGDFYVTDFCNSRPTWGMAECPEVFGKLRVSIGGADRLQTSPIMVRDDIPNVAETLTAEKSSDFMVILGGSHSYTLHWSDNVPKEFTLHGIGVDMNHAVRIGVCMPEQPDFDLYTYSPTWAPNLQSWNSVSSVAALEADDSGKSYFLDSSTGMLFFNFRDKYVRGEDEVRNCVENCPMVKVIVNNADRSRGDCRSVAYPKFERSPTLTGPLTESTETRPATSAEPPSSLGAGLTKPFPSRLPVDGEYSEWSEWSQCSVTCGGGTKSRDRKCNNPTPVNGGADCDGPSVEALECGMNACPAKVDGGFSDWTDWFYCIPNNQDDCQGHKIRQRWCNNPEPQHGGSFCDGPIMEMTNCNNCPA